MGTNMTNEQFEQFLEILKQIRDNLEIIADQIKYV